MKPLKAAKAALRVVRRALEPGEASWKRKRNGTCAVCRVYGRVVLHHLVREQDIRRATSKEQQAAGIVWDRRNALQIGAPMHMGGRCRCHDRHHNFVRDDDKLDYKHVTPEAKEFAVEIFGENAAVEYWRKRYRNAP